MTKNNEQKTICDFCGARDCLITHCKIGSIFRRKKQECEELKKYQYEQEFLQEQLDKVIKENKELKTCYKNNLTLLDKEEVNTTKLVNKVMKLEKILAEIKEIAYDGYNNGQTSYATFQLGKIIDKINEVEDVNN